MFHSHYLQSNTHQEFLSENRIDPITGEKIEAGHSVVICAACKSAFFVESWEYLGGSHCQQSETLAELPKPKNYYLQPKPTDFLPFDFKGLDNKLYAEDYIRSVINVVFGLAILGGTFYAVKQIKGFISLMVGFLLFQLIRGIFEYRKNTIKKRKKSLPKWWNYIFPRGRASQLGINYHKRSLVIRSYKNEVLIPFGDIIGVSYYSEYASNRGTTCVMYVRIFTRAGTYTTQSYVDLYEMPIWSEFLEKLPNDMRVLNSRNARIRR